MFTWPNFVRCPRWGAIAELILVWCLVAGATHSTSATPARPEELWSFKPIVRPLVPRVPRVPRPAAPEPNPIDAFIRRKLAEHHLSPSPQADRRTLIRRLYYDLLGLPPTPEAVAAFVADPDPAAYTNLVDRLLDSPRYGERWARHWLDVVRFAETHGFEMNNPRPNAWRYRDYVIRAFNADTPYSQFVAKQLAGDVLGADEATGFLVAGAWDQVKSPDPVLTANQRADELHDMVSTTASALLGLTVGCARCHDHKFDPIPQRDYYALKAVLAGVEHGERPLRTPEILARETEVKTQREELIALERALEEFAPLARVAGVTTDNLRAPVNPRRNVDRFLPVATQRLRFIIRQTTDAEPCLDELEVWSAEAAPHNVALASAGAKASASGTFPNSELHRLEHLNDGRYGNAHSWISNQRGQGWVELEFPAVVTINKVVWGRDREQKYTDRLAVDYRIEVASSTNDWQLVASAADRDPYVPNRVPQPLYGLGRLAPAEQARARALLEEWKIRSARLKELSLIPLAYAGNFDAQPVPTCRLNRGDPMQPREEVAPGALSALYVPFRLAPADAAGDAASASATCAGLEVSPGCATPLTADQQRRLALARWIIDPANPLTARVIVNRLWLYHFGEGLVSTPSDFGAHGAQPTHPELLDWLAAELVQPTETGPTRPRAWSLKHIQRLIVTSATYRQSSAARPASLATDASARWWWRFPPRRLEAEPIRDAILAVSGKLDLRMGGPGFSFFEPNENYVRVYNPKQEYGPEDWRRTIYGTVVRQRPDGVFGAFDCPDGGQIAPKRTRSTTPLQALNLLNSAFVLQQAGFFAQRLRLEAGTEVNAQIRDAFALAFQRAPEPEELDAAVKFLGQQDERLEVFCRALFNANEFVYLF